MKIRQIELKNFRNYENLSIEFSESLNFIIGENAAGKTNLLEAIGYFSLYRSFRGVNDSFLVREGQNWFYMRIVLENNAETFTYEVGLEKRDFVIRKKIKKNERKVEKVSEILRDIPFIFFLPADLEIIESVTYRRNYFDVFFSTIDNEYLNAYFEYHKCLKHRNILLKKILEKKSDVNELNFWDEKIIANSLIIMKKRDYYLQKFSLFFDNRIKEISNNKDYVYIKLQQFEEEEFVKLFRDSKFRDIYSGKTNYGIHKDKFEFYDKNSRQIENSFSQGQKRTVVISLKLAQYDFIIELLKQKPILLIDDVIREFDQYRRKYFLDLLLNCGQVFFTTPAFDDDMNIFKRIKGNSCKIFEISQGKLINVF